MSKYIMMVVVLACSACSKEEPPLPLSQIPPSRPIHSSPRAPGARIGELPQPARSRGQTSVVSVDGDRIYLKSLGKFTRVLYGVIIRIESDAVYTGHVVIDGFKGGNWAGTVTLDNSSVIGEGPRVGDLVQIVRPKKP